MDNYSSAQLDDMDRQWRKREKQEHDDEKNNHGEPYTEKDRLHNETIKKQKQGDDSND